MKTLPLNQAWRLCLKQWKWIVGQKPECPRAVWRLKGQWLRDNGFRLVTNDCFFCEYGRQQADEEKDEDDCDYCPARLVNKRFDCYAKTYSFKDRPQAFLAKLLELDKKRKSKK